MREWSGKMTKCMRCFAFTLYTGVVCYSVTANHMRNFVAFALFQSDFEASRRARHYLWQRNPENVWLCGFENEFDEFDRHDSDSDNKRERSLSFSELSNGIHSPTQGHFILVILSEVYT